jgi:hypothetical protein
MRRIPRVHQTVLNTQLAEAPPKIPDEHGLRPAMLAVVAVLNAMSTLGATLHDSDEFVAWLAAQARPPTTTPTAPPYIDDCVTTSPN